jgi:hypothetical protein
MPPGSASTAESIGDRRSRQAFSRHACGCRSPRPHPGNRNPSGVSDLPATVIYTEYQQVIEMVASVQLDPYCSLAPRFLGVVDANAILSSVDNDRRKGPHWRSRLLRMASGGTAVLYVPDHVYGEVYRRMPKIARSSPVPLAVLRERFEAEYLPSCGTSQSIPRRSPTRRCSPSPTPTTHRTAGQADRALRRVL